MPYPKAPCRDCEKRQIGCHSNCDPYKKFRSEIEDISMKKREASEKNLRCRSKASRVSYFWQKN